MNRVSLNKQNINKKVVYPKLFLRNFSFFLKKKLLIFRLVRYEIDIELCFCGTYLKLKDLQGLLKKQNKSIKPVSIYQTYCQTSKVCFF